MKKLSTIPQSNLIESSVLRDIFNKIALNIKYSTIDKNIKTIMITSSIMGEGKTTISVNTAISLAMSGEKVLLVDSDFRQPRVHKHFNIVNNNGFSNAVFLDDYADVVIETEINDLYIMTSGLKPPNPVTLLSSAKIYSMFERMKEDFDYIIIDTPPVLVVPDALSLSKISDGIIIVAKHMFTHEKTLLESKKALDVVDGNIIGSILTQYKETSRGGKYRYGYGYGYGNNYGYSNNDVSDYAEDVEDVDNNLNSKKNSTQDRKFVYSRNKSKTADTKKRRFKL